MSWQQENPYKGPETASVWEKGIPHDKETEANKLLGCGITLGFVVGVVFALAVAWVVANGGIF